MPNVSENYQSFLKNLMIDIRNIEKKSRVFILGDKLWVYQNNSFQSKNK